MVFKKIVNHIWHYYARTWPFVVSFVLLIGHNCLKAFIIQRICFTILLAIVFSPIYLWLRRYRLQILIYAFIVLLFFLERFLVLNFSRTIGPDVFLMMAETNPVEAGEFVTAFGGTRGSIRCYAECIMVSMMIFVLEVLNRRRKRINIPFSFKGMVVVCSIALLLAGTPVVNTWEKLLKFRMTYKFEKWETSEKIKYFDLLSKLVYSAKGVLLARDEIQLASTVMERFDGELAFCQSEDSLNVVLVIGESCILKHLGIYGYTLDTTPNMQFEKDRGNLFAFDDVISPYCTTTPSIKNLMACNSTSHVENWADFPFFPFIFKKAGYQVFFWDNQKQKDVDRGYTFTLNSFLYNRNILPVYSQTNDTCFFYDGDFIDSFLHEFSDMEAGRHNLFMFHLMGQHTPYRNRFPNDGRFDYFNTDSIRRNEDWMTRKKKQMIAEYDNATRYHDFVLSKLFEHFRGTNTVLVYLSDHGEEVFDYRDSFGRKRENGKITKNVVDYQYRIPFFIWMTEKYRALYPEKVEAIKRSLHKPFISDITHNLLLNLANIKTNLYREDLDLISDKYNLKKRLLQRKYDCDSILSKE